jgi:heme exporter protein D
VRVGYYCRKTFRINIITIAITVFNTVRRYNVSLQGYKQRERRDSVIIYVLERATREL